MIYLRNTHRQLNRGLYAHWLASPDRFKDVGPYKRHITSLAGTIDKWSGPNKSNIALKCDGTTIGTITFPALGSPFSITGWINPQNVDTFAGLLVNNTGSAGLFHKGDTGKLSFYSTGDHLTTATIPERFWTPFGMRYDGADVFDFFLNGLFDSTHSFLYLAFEINRIFSDEAGENFTGGLADIRVYNRILSSGEFKELAKPLIIPSVYYPPIGIKAAEGGGGDTEEIDVTDNLTVAITDASTNLLNSAVEDDLEISITDEIASLLVALAVSDSISLSLTEAIALLGIANVSDSVGLSLTEALEILSRSDISDNISLTISDSSGISVNLSVSDSITLSVEEATALEMIANTMETYLRRYLGDVETVGTPGEAVSEPTTLDRGDEDYMRRYLNDKRNN